MTPCLKDILYPSKTFEVLSNALITYDCVFPSLGSLGRGATGKGNRQTDICGSGLWQWITSASTQLGRGM